LVEISNVTIDFQGQVIGSPWTINTEFTTLTFAFENSFNCTNNPVDSNEPQSGFVKFTVTPHHHNVTMNWEVDGAVEIVQTGFDTSTGIVAPIGEIDPFKPYFVGRSVTQVTYLPTQGDDRTCSAGLPRFIFDGENFIRLLEKGKSYDIFFGVDSVDELYNSNKMFYTLTIEYTKA